MQQEKNIEPPFCIPSPSNVFLAWLSRGWVLLPHRTKERSYVFREQLWFLHRGEVTTTRHVRPALHMVEALNPLSWRKRALFRKMCHRARNLNAFPLLKV